MVHDDCVDRPSPDNFGCEMQAEWKKCNEDWVQDEGLFSGRTLGYCERSCGRCTCAEGDCGRADVYDIPASNGKTFPSPLLPLSVSVSSWLTVSIIFILLVGVGDWGE